MSDHAEKNRKNYVRAAYAPDGPGAASMIEVLREHGIDSFRQGGTKDIYKIGGDIFGEEIMVPPEDLSRAQELLHASPDKDKLTAGTQNRGRQMKKALLSLLAAAVLLAVLLFLRGRFLA
jgi:hypothetical protein